MQAEVMEKTSEQVPAMRFAGFKGPWKTQAFGELAEFTKGKGISKQDISPEGELPCIRYAELYTVYGEVIDEVVSRTALESDELELSQAGDVIIPASGETAEDIARAACVKNAGVALGGDLNIIRSSLVGTFLAYHLNGVQRLAIASLAQGKSVVHLYPHQLRILDIRFPTLPEQQKIAAFLGAVDRKIQQLKRKHALLEQCKKGVVQQLFSQELRFKKKDGGEFPEWEEKRLGDICSTFKSGEGITADEIDIGGEYPVYGGNGLRGFTDSFTHDGYYVLIGRQGALCGNINRVRGKVYISEHAIAVQCDKSSDTEWLAQLLTYMNLNRLSESSAQPGLAVNKLVQLKVSVPSLEEQSRIAGFLMALDAKVAGVAAAVAAAQKWKKGLLQQMFV